ncbi:MAG: hypothetical protein JJT94_05485 [Bernardetiaceae bacterium]|nr:hypothetical protein [Bernardetiaceae bacterium]
MKQNLMTAGLISIILLLFMAFTGEKSSKEPEKREVTYEYMHINVLESVIEGGGGRSRMLVTGANGQSLSRADLNNYYSMVGINFKNIEENDGRLVGQLNLLAQEGWEVVGVSSGGGNVYFTKYLLKREKR